MTAKRMNREQFFGKLAALDEPGLQKALWNVYWRGTAKMRERIEVELEPKSPGPRTRTPKPEVDPEWVLYEVREFDELARAGAYMGGDRRVAPRERSRWRFTFQRLTRDAQDALRVDDDGTAGAAAMTMLIDLACASRDVYYFRSEDPVGSARFVVSDAAAALWAAVRDHQGADEFAKSAAAQLIRWESRFGWTRSGYGAISEKETTLARVLASMLPSPEAWIAFADHYLDALEEVGASAVAKPSRDRSSRELERKERSRNLAGWHHLLLDKLIDYDTADRLERLVDHPALGGPELTFVKARLAHWQGATSQARGLVYECLEELPDASEVHDFAAEIGADVPPRAREWMDQRRRPLTPAASGASTA